MNFEVRELSYKDGIVTSPTKTNSLNDCILELQELISEMQTDKSENILIKYKKSTDPSSFGKLHRIYSNKELTCSELNTYVKVYNIQ